MTNIVPSDIQVPAHLAGKVGVPSVLAQSLTGGLSSGGEGFPRISIKGSRFRIVDGGTETLLDSTKLDIIVVGANPRLSKTWYEKPWTPDAEPSAPDCFSLDGVGPHVDSTKPQNDLCASCPQNAWGSKVTPQGQQVKACADQKRLAVVAADDPTGSVYLLQVTPGALKGLNSYQKELSTRGIPPEIVKTTISFDTDASYPKLAFSFGGFINEAAQEAVDKLFGIDAVLTITGEKEIIKEATIVSAPAIEEAPVKEAPAEKKEVKGFGKVATEEPKAKPKAKKAAEEPDAAPVVDAAASNLADEIAALVGDVADDK
jgi:hypothetical protein